MSFLAILGYLMIITFMTLMMRKKMSPFTSLLIVPLVYGFIGGFGTNLGKYAIVGVKTVVPTAMLLVFSLLFFSVLVDTGMFDPVVKKIIKICKGDPLKVIIGTACIVGFISIDGDGSSTYVIICAAMLPIYKKLGINPMILAIITIIQNGAWNILPWGGPTARVLVGLNVEAGEIMWAYYPAMLAVTFYGIFVAYILGRRERKRIGIIHLSDEELDGLSQMGGDEVNNYKRPKFVVVNFILTGAIMATIIADVYPPGFVFGIGAALALIINYPKISIQKQLIEKHASNAFPILCTIFAAGCFMGIFGETKMTTAIAQHLVSIIPPSMGSHLGVITALISIPGAVALSNEGFYLGIVPILAKTAATYGFTNPQIGIAALTGQAFHLMSPLVASVYILIQLTGADDTTFRLRSAAWSIPIYGIYFVFVFFIMKAVPL